MTFSLLLNKKSKWLLAQLSSPVVSCSYSSRFIQCVLYYMHKTATTRNLCGHITQNENFKIRDFKSETIGTAVHKNEAVEIPPGSSGTSAHTYSFLHPPFVSVKSSNKFFCIRKGLSVPTAFEYSHHLTCIHRTIKYHM